MKLENLEKLGFSNSEAKVYLTLLQLGSSQAVEISKKSNLNRTTTYEALKRLIERGIVSYSIHANKKSFKANSPNKILEFFKDQERLAQEITSELNVLYKKPKEKEEFDIYEGRKGMRSILNDILKHDEYIAFGSSGKFLEIMKHDFVAFQNRKKELRIKAKIILNESSRKEESVKLAHASFKFIPDKYSGPSTTFVYGKNVAIIVWGVTPIATVIKSKEVSKSFKNYFNYLWKTAKR